MALAFSTQPPESDGASLLDVSTRRDDPFKRPEASSFIYKPVKKAHKRVAANKKRAQASIDESRARINKAVLGFFGMLAPLALPNAAMLMPKFVERGAMPSGSKIIQAKTGDQKPDGTKNSIDKQLKLIRVQHATLNKGPHSPHGYQRNLQARPANRHSEGKNMPAPDMTIRRRDGRNPDGPTFN